MHRLGTRTETSGDSNSWESRTIASKTLGADVLWGRLASGLSRVEGQMWKGNDWLQIRWVHCLQYRSCRRLSGI
jgi:hypothetical protein